MPRPDAPRLCRVAGRTTWHIYHQRRRISTGCEDRAQAEVVLARYIEGEAKPKSAVTSISDILTLYLADRADEQIPGYSRLEWAHKPLKLFFGEKPTETVGAAACKAYYRVRSKDGVAPATVRTELQALRAALNWAAKGKKIAQSPEVWFPARPAPRDRWLTRDEAAALIAACRALHVRLFCLVALHTAARRGAILGLRWSRVDLDRRLIDFVAGQQQTRKGRARVPINDTLLAGLKEAHKLSTTDFVIEYGGGSVASVKHGFSDACARANLTGVSPHTLRHTAATWMVQAGVPIWEVAGFLGHSSPQMVSDTYGHHSPEHLQRGAKVLG